LVGASSCPQGDRFQAANVNFLIAPAFKATCTSFQLEAILVIATPRGANQPGSQFASAARLNWLELQ